MISWGLGYHFTPRLSYERRRLAGFWGAPSSISGRTTRGRPWSRRGGRRFTEASGFARRVAFAICGAWAPRRAPACEGDGADDAPT